MDFLSEFQFDVLHIPGEQNTAADGLSRRPDHYRNDDGSARFADGVEDTEIASLQISGQEYIRTILQTYSQDVNTNEYTCAIREKETLTSDIAEVFDRLSIISGGILLSIFEADDTVRKVIQDAYETDSLAQEIIKEPEKFIRYKKFNNLIYRIKLDGGKALYIPETAKMLSKDKQIPLRDLL